MKSGKERSGPNLINKDATRRHYVHNLQQQRTQTNHTTQDFKHTKRNSNTHYSCVVLARMTANTLTGTCLRITIVF